MSASTLCQRCGLCCDGTLFARAPVEPAEVPALAARGLAIDWPEGGMPGLRQPCAALAGLSCAIYAERPAGCRRFECRLLGALGEGEVGLEEALEVVADARARVAAGDGELAALLDLRFRGVGRR
jgi:hypothetical protein